MKKVIFLLAALSFILISCNQSKKKSSSSAGDLKFQQISDDFIQGTLENSPELGVYLGFHEYDGKSSDLSKESLQNELVRLKKYDKMLNEFDTGSLGPAIFSDFRILKSSIKYSIFYIEQIEPYTKNPMTYAGELDVSIYIKRNFAPLEDRLKSIISIEKKARAVFAAARANLEDSLAKPFVETAIQIAEGYIDFLKGDLIVALKEVKNDSLMAVFKKVNNNAINELKAFSGYLKKEKLPRAHNNFAIGKERYQEMLQYGEGISITPDKILEIGLAELQREKAVFDSTAKRINPNKKPAEVFSDIQKDHPTSESLVSDVKKNLEIMRQFLVDKKIVSIPSEVRVKVEETPEYARSTSTASMSTPGPFEKKATEAYYYVTPVDPKWTSKQKEGWLSNFNFYTTDLTSIHEAYPGHYIQFLHLNASAATKIEKIFSSYAFIEGWAHYTEKMMIDEGYGNTGDSVKGAKYRLAQSNEALLRLCRLCVSIKMHCQGMSVDDAARFFTDNMYTAEKGSQQEATRGTFDPGYLYYTLGKLQILKLRSDFMKQEGSNFSLQMFHDLILDNGMPPIYLLREKLLKDKKSWKEIL